MKRAAVYARLSMQGEDAESIKRQRLDGLHYWETLGWATTEYLEPVGARSGFSEKRRPAYRQLKEDIKAGQLHGVWFADLSRASRSLIELFALIDLCQKNNVRFVSQKENIDPDSAIGRAMLGVIGVFNEWYRNDLSERQKRRVAFRKSNAQTLGKIPLGLIRNADKRYEPSPETYTHLGKERRYLDTILRFMHFYQCGDYGAQTSAMRLGKEGYRWRSNHKQPIPVDEHHITWTIKILESYRGCVPDALLDKCLRVRAQRASHSANGNQRTSAPPLLWRLIRCHHCGLRYGSVHAATYYTTRTGEKKASWFMRYRHPGVTCPVIQSKRTHNARTIDAQMVGIIQWVARRPHIEKERVVAALSAPPTATAPAVSPAEIDRRLERLKTLFVMGDIDRDAYEQDRDKLLELKRPAPTPPDTLSEQEARDAVEELPAALLAASENNPTLANQILRELIDRVDVQDGAIVSFTPHARYAALFAGHPLCQTPH